MTADIFKIAAAGVVCAIIIMILKERRPDFAVAAALTSGVIILLAAAPAIKEALSLFDKLSRYDGAGYFKTIIKIIGIAYIAEFGGQLCADADAKALAANVELAGKAAIVAAAVPIITDLFNKVLAL